MSGYHVTYVWHWPGTPGGYEPVIANELMAEKARAEEAKKARAAKVGQQSAARIYKRKKTPAGLRLPSAGRSIIGISAKANAAVAAYEKRGLEMIAARAARKLKKAA